MLFEFCEIILDDHLANFKECWWDHVGLHCMLPSWA